MTNTRTTSEAAVSLTLGYDPRRMQRTEAFNLLVDRATEAYSRFAEFTEDDDPDAHWEAMNAALGRVARGFAASTLEALLREDLLELTLEQVSRLEAVLIKLDSEIVEILSEPGTRPCPNAGGLSGM